MKKYGWFLLVLYFGIFVAFGIIFYLKYSDRFFRSGSQPQNIKTPSATDYIYYSENNNLYRINSGLQIDPANPERIERLQSTGEVNDLDISENGLQLAYEVKINQNYQEIWLVDLSSKSSKKIAFGGQQDLSDYKNFIKPKFNSDGSLLAFIGVGTVDQIIVYNLTNENFKVASKKFAVKMTDFSWETNQKIIFCTSGLISNSCNEIDLNSENDRTLFPAESLQISAAETYLIYLGKNSTSVNLFRFNFNEPSPIMISDLNGPKIVSNFNQNKQAQAIAYEVTDNNLTDIYFVSIDGANKIQLTTDGQSKTPIFNPSGTEIVFSKPDGFYVMNTNKTNVNKIINLATANVKLLYWR